MFYGRQQKSDIIIGEQLRQGTGCAINKAERLDGREIIREKDLSSPWR
jgi:hypothetical protein